MHKNQGNPNSGNRILLTPALDQKRRRKTFDVKVYEQRPFWRLMRTNSSFLTAFLSFASSPGELFLVASLMMTNGGQKALRKSSPFVASDINFLFVEALDISDVSTIIWRYFSYF